MAAKVLQFPAQPETDTPDDLAPSLDLIKALAVYVATWGSPALALRALDDARARVA